MVDAPPAPAETEESAQEPPIKKLALDLGAYNRAAEPTRAKDAPVDNKSDYFRHQYRYQAESEVVPSVRGGARGYAGGGFGGLTEEARQSTSERSNVDRGRARRLQVQAQSDYNDLALSVGTQPSGSADESGRARLGAEVMKRRAMLRELKTPAAGGDQPLQVLFVLRAGDESPPSAPAANRAE
jgi:hypothetical protein